MINKFLLILFIGFLSTYAGEIKAEEICYYKTVEEYKKCISLNKYNLKQSFPTFFGSSGGGEHEFVLWLECPNGRKECLDIKKKNKAIRLFSKDGKNLEIRYGRLALWTGQKFKTRETQIIRKTKIISWKKEEFRKNKWNFNLFNLKYVDESYKLKDLYFLSESVFNYGGNTRIRVKQHTEYIEKFLISFTNLNEGETNDSNNQKIIDAAKKERDILGSIIAKPNINSGCKEIDDIKFPELSKKYKKLSDSIYLLKKKLNLNQLNNLRSICS